MQFDHFNSNQDDVLMSIKDLSSICLRKQKIESYKKAKEIYPSMQSPEIMIKQIENLIKQELI